MATRTDLTASSSTSEAGSAVTFEAAVTGTGVTPTGGTVIFKDGENVLGSVALSEGRARLTTSALPVGQRTIAATYSGDDTFEGSVSAALSHEVVKATTTIALTVSGTGSDAGQAVIFTAEVTSAGGTPTGTVTFKEGKSDLHSAELSEGRAQWITSDLAAGQHTITAAYGGDAAFGPSTSQPRTYRIRQANDRPQNMPAILIPILVLVLLALLILLRRLASRWLFRPLSRGLKALSGGYRRVLRFGRRAPAREQPVKAFVSQGVRGMAFAETDDAFADFDKSLVKINRHFRLGCSWIEPAFAAERNGQDADKDSDKTKSESESESERAKEDLEKARADFEKAKELFATSVPLDSNALNLYDDIHNAFIVNVLGRSDKACLYVLSEFGKVISANVLCLAVVFSSVVTLVAAVNIVASDWIPFDRYVGSVRISLPILGIHFDIPPLLGIGLPAEFNKAVFATFSCLAGYMLLLMFYQLAYEQLQRLNGQQMDKFLVSYLSRLEVQFSGIKTSATTAVVDEKQEEEMRRETVMWITNLQWTAWRVFFIEEFLRNIWFQIRRDRIYSLFLVPLIFVLLIIFAALIAHSLAPGMLQLEYRQYSLYLLFPILLYWCYRRLRGSLSPVGDSLQRQWAKFRNLNVVHELTRIMSSYVNQLHMWRNRFGPGNQ